MTDKVCAAAEHHHEVKQFQQGDTRGRPRLD